MLVAIALPCSGDAEPDSQVKELCRRLGSNEEGVRWRAAEELIKAGPKATGTLGTILLGEWLEGRKLAAYILGETKDPAAVPALAKSLGDDDFHVRWKCAVSLKNIGKPSVDALIDALGKGNLNAQYCAAWVLGEIREPKATLALAWAATSDDEDLRWKAVISLKRIGPAAVDGLRRLVTDKNVESRRCAVWSLGELATDDAVEPLLDATADADADVRLKAIAALAKFDLPQVRAALGKLAESKDPAIAKQAVISLARLGKAAGIAAGDQGSHAAVARKGIGDDHVPQWQTYEIAATAWSHAPARPMPSDAVLEATFLTPDQGSISVPGFRTGAGWAVRIAPDQPGEWFYKITLTAGERVETKHGMFSCDQSELPAALVLSATPARRDAPVGRLRPYISRVQPDDGAGKPFFLIEAPTPAAGLPLDADAWKPLIDACSVRGFNLLRLDLSAMLLYAAPETKRAAERFLETIIPYGHEKGVYFLLTLLDESHVRARGFGPLGAGAAFPMVYDPTAPAVSAIQEAYIADVLAKTAAYANVLFELCRGFNTNRSAVPFARGWAEKRMRLFAGVPRATGAVAAILSPADDVSAICAAEGVQVAGVPDLKLARGRAAGLVVPCPDDPSDAFALAWLAAMANGSFVSWSRSPVNSLDDAVRFVEQAGSGARVLADYMATEDLFAFRLDPAMVLAVPPGMQAAALNAGRRAIIFLAGNSQGGEMVRIGMPPGEFTIRWMSIRTGLYNDPVVGKQDRGAIELQCPRFTGGMLAEIDVQ